MARYNAPLCNFADITDPMGFKRALAKTSYRVPPREYTFVMIAYNHNGYLSEMRYSANWNIMHAKYQKYSYHSPSKFYIMSRDTYAELIRISELNYTLEEYTQLISTFETFNEQGPTHMTALAIPANSDNKTVFVVFNITHQKCVTFHYSEEAALENATNLSRQSPTQQFLILKPSKLVYQPVNIQIEEVGA